MNCHQYVSDGGEISFSPQITFIGWDRRVPEERPPQPGEKAKVQETPLREDSEKYYANATVLPLWANQHDPELKRPDN